MKPHTKKWRAIPSTLHTSNPASVRMDIVDDGAEFSPAFVAGDIMPEDARLMASSPRLLASLENLERMATFGTVTEECLREARSSILEAKGQP